MPHTHHTHTHTSASDPEPTPVQPDEPHVNGWALILIFAILATIIVVFMKGIVEPRLRKRFPPDPIEPDYVI